MLAWCFPRWTHSFSDHPSGGLHLEEAVDEGLVRGNKGSPLEHESRLVWVAGKPQLVGQEEEQVRIVRVPSQHFFQLLSLVGEIGSVHAVQVARVETGRGPVRLQAHPVVN